MAGGHVIALELAQDGRLDVAAAMLEARTARMEDAGRRRIDGRRDIAAEDDPLPLARPLPVRLRARHCGETPSRIPVPGVFVDKLPPAHLHHAPSVPNRD